MPSTEPLLQATDGPAVQTINAAGTNDIVLVCEHASNRIPAALDGLGLSEAALTSHAAWDPGAQSVALLLSKSLDAVLISAGFSRLVYDLNRPPEHPDAMRAVSEIYQIPGNADLSAQDRTARTEGLYKPFHDEIDRILERYQAEGRAPVLVTIHTFTPVYLGQTRAVELGILHDHGDTRLADQILDAAPAITELVTRRNEPYGPEDGVAHSLQMHALPGGLLNVMLEIRNDLVTSADQQHEMARIVETLLLAATEKTATRIPQSTGADA